MVFESSAHFEQFIHCRFRENVVRVVVIPTVIQKRLFLVVNKFGKVGLYDLDQRMKLVHAYLLDLSAWHHPGTADDRRSLPPRPWKSSAGDIPQPKCRQMHWVVDAAWAPLLRTVFYLTNKGTLQRIFGPILSYDTGEIDAHRYGVELLPEKRFGPLKAGQSSTAIKNAGHAETHRVYGLPLFPTAMEFYEGTNDQDGDEFNRRDSFLLIGSSGGEVLIIRILDKKNVFGWRKIRGVVHHVTIEDLGKIGAISIYDTQGGPITDLRILSERHFVVLSTNDSRRSLVFIDLRHILKNRVISVPSGVCALAHYEMLQILVTGSNDGVIRIFNDLVPSAPIGELNGHIGPIKSLEFFSAPFTYPEPILLSFSGDVELRVWDPSNWTCLQSIHISFPVKSAILCKTPEFPRRAILVYENEVAGDGSAQKNLGTINVFYCNSFAKLKIKKDASYWPFDFDDMVADFQEISAKVQKRLKWEEKKQLQLSSSKDFQVSKNPRQQVLSIAEMEAVEDRLNSYVNEVLELKGDADAALDVKVTGRSTANSQGLSARLLRKTYAVQKNDLRLIQEGGAFKVIPTIVIEPIEFSEKELPVTDLMTKEGLTVVRPSDLLTPAAQHCFSAENMKQISLLGSMAKMNYEETLTMKVDI